MRLPSSRSLSALVLLIVLAAAAPAVAADAPTATVDTGALRGVDQGATQAFLGIPYAKPPVGKLRLKAPQPAAHWSGTRDATEPGKSCIQAPGPEAPKGSTSENCLYLNVTRPAAKSATKRPVMVWLHGGGGTIGNGAEYEPQRLADEGNVVVVTVNYRLGALGSLSLPGLRGGGTFGLADMVAALRWTKRNAAAFGGDPGNVTAFGESNGGFAICGLLTSPAAKGLFEKASMSSGNCNIDFPPGGFIQGTPAVHKFIPKGAADKAGLGVAKGLGCTGKNVVACVRRAPAAKFEKSPLDFYATGTPLLPRTPSAALAAGRFAHVPVIIGTNHDESNGPIGAADSARHMTRAQYPELLRTAFGTGAARVLKAYPLSKNELPAQTYAQVMTDGAWACPTAGARDALGKATKTYAYEFSDPHAPNVDGVRRKGFTIGAAHASDVPYLFDLMGKSLLTTQPQKDLASTMICYWSRFARTGDPNGRDAPDWGRYTGDGVVHSLAPGAIRPVEYDTEHRCSFWAGRG